MPRVASEQGFGLFSAPDKGIGRRAGRTPAMAGYVPGQLPLNRSQEKEFVQAYEDVLERYKGGPVEGRRRLGGTLR
ncbi:UNVERIFIED_CONTAM: hypothetical protein K2H54_043985 [Gekko kuhli]